MVNRCEANVGHRADLCKESSGCCEIMQIARLEVVALISGRLWFPDRNDLGFVYDVLCDQTTIPWNN